MVGGVLTEGVALLELEVGEFIPLVRFLFTTGSVVVFGFFLYMVAGSILSPTYSPKRSDEKAENFRLVLTTVAEPHIRDALMETIEYHLEHFSEYEFFVVVDEGAQLAGELRAKDGLKVVTVPEDYECKAEAKGRAINYFIESVVADTPEYWYGFFDDDNRILGDEFLYEIPYYEQRGYGVMNGITIPRLGRSKLSFVEDHMRLFEDLTFFRLFVGVWGKPYTGLHGELLTVRGDVLADITFNRKTIVEDFAFAIEVCREDVKTWQSATKVSILSPHSVLSWLKQRRRWYLGKVKYLPRTPPLTILVVGFRQTLLALSFTAAWVFAPLWPFFNPLSLPILIYVGVFVATVVHFVVCLYGAYRIAGVKSIYLGFLTPFYALMEQFVPIFSTLRSNPNFVVIEK